MALKVPETVLRNVPDTFKVGDWAEVWTHGKGADGKGPILGNNVRVCCVDFYFETVDGFVFYANDSREWRTGIPFADCELLDRPGVSGGETANTRDAIDRFTKRFLDHARRPGGTKPGHTVTPESAREIALQCADRADTKAGN